MVLVCLDDDEAEDLDLESRNWPSLSWSRVVTFFAVAFDLEEQRLEKNKNGDGRELGCDILHLQRFWRVSEPMGTAVIIQWRRSRSIRGIIS